MESTRSFRATTVREWLHAASTAGFTLNGVPRRLLKMAPEQLRLIETHIKPLDGEALDLMQEHQDAVQRVAAVPGFAVDSARGMLAEVGPEVAACRSQKAQGSRAARVRPKATAKCVGF